MAISTEKLAQFFEQVKTLTFWQRLFRWARFRKLSYEAYNEFKALSSEHANCVQELVNSKSSLAITTKDIEHLRESQSKHDSEVNALEAKLTALQEKNTALRDENTIFKNTEDERKRKYENDVASLNSIRERIQEDRDNEVAETNRKEIERLTQKREYWAKHQEAVKDTIKMICERHTIEYVEKVPFKGNPDNTLKICDEYIIFDAKSPGSDDLRNFPTYIRSQTESLKKYIKEEGVKKQIYLVIPSNAVELMERFTYNMADYTVYVVTLDALEPIILSLKKLEEYEFIDRLSPEERENICKVIGKFFHMTKRRIQIDQFFQYLSLEVLSKSEADLPRDIFEKVEEYERYEKLNPPQEKRAKQLSRSGLHSHAEKIRKEAEAKGITFPASGQQGIKSLPLYEDETSENDKI